jgi:hypothetical protein
MAAPVKNMRTIFPTSVDTTVTTTSTSSTDTDAGNRTTAIVTGGTLASVAPAATVTGVVTMAKSLMLQKLVCTYPSRVRLYSTAALRDADVTRPNSSPVVAGSQHGMICDLYLTTGNLAWILSPAVEGSNMDDGSGNLYFSITNIDTVTRSLSVTFTYVTMEI